MAEESSWTFDAEPPATDSGTVTLIEQTSFCVCGGNGNLDPAWPHGLFFHDTRILSRWLLTVDGTKVEPLTVLSPHPYEARFVGRARALPGKPHSTLLVERHRYVGSGMREDIVIRNLAVEPAAVTVELAIEADFADLFQVKESRVRPRPGIVATADGAEVRIEHRSGDDRRGVRIVATGDAEPASTENSMTFTPKIDGRSTWTVSIEVRPLVGEEDVTPDYPVDRPVADTPTAERTRIWNEQSPIVRSADNGLMRTLRTSRRDLGALRIFDPQDPSTAAIAAGAPWFMALFGRDSLLTSLMVLPLDPTLALGTLRTLARYQGTTTDVLTEEEPGRILHEMRLGANAKLTLGGGSVYYGTVDATPLFVILLAELCRWGLGDQHLDELLPAADRALGWIDSRLDERGFLTYQRASDRGLVNQGWRDSWDGINYADGSLPKAPVALCEVQAYVYAAFVARAHIAREQGDDDAQQHWQERAEQMSDRFNEHFWLPDRGYYAVALDGAGKPVDALTSNIGHCLWAGIADHDKARQVADHLLSDEMFSGWGVRTLATSMGRYNPLSYHNGSVWPHDNAIVTAGLMRYGFVEQASRIAVGMLDAAEHFDGRLPEVFSGLSRNDFDSPVQLPTSCSPQAWSAATPIYLLRTLLRFNPSVSQGSVTIDPVLPARMLPLDIENLPVGNARLRIDVQKENVRVDGLTPDLALFPVTIS